MAMASLKREGRRLLLLSRASSTSSIAARSAIFSDELEPMEVSSMPTQAVRSSMKNTKNIQEVAASNLRGAQVRTENSRGVQQPFNALIWGTSRCRSPFILNLRRTFSSNINQLPAISDPDIEAALKDLLAINWDEIPDTVISATKKVLSKASEDKAGQEALANVFRAAEASVEFSGVLVSLRMALDDLGGLSGENVGHLPEHLEDAIRAAYKRYVTYLDSFGPDETFLRKKVELELGTKMIHLKMRCSGIGSEWGKVTLLGTSGLSGSYVELRS